ncbi:MAG: hypothetical protein RL208_475, partial [Pseudomonadota bacterium]
RPHSNNVAYSDYRFLLAGDKKSDQLDVISSDFQSILAPNASKLNIENCDDLQYIFAPNVTKLNITNGPKLEHIFAPNVKECNIEGCPKLNYSFNSRDENEEIHDNVVKYISLSLENRDDFLSNYMDRFGWDRLDEFLSISNAMESKLQLDLHEYRSLKTQREQDAFLLKYITEKENTKYDISNLFSTISKEGFNRDDFTLRILDNKQNATVLCGFARDNKKALQSLGIVFIDFDSNSLELLAPKNKNCVCLLYLSPVENLKLKDYPNLKYVYTSAGAVNAEGCNKLQYINANLAAQLNINSASGELKILTKHPSSIIKIDSCKDLRKLSVSGCKKVDIKGCNALTIRSILEEMFSSSIYSALVNQEDPNLLTKRLFEDLKNNHISINDNKVNLDQLQEELKKIVKRIDYDFRIFSKKVRFVPKSKSSDSEPSKKSNTRSDILNKVLKEMLPYSVVHSLTTETIEKKIEERRQEGLQSLDQVNDNNIKIVPNQI